MGLFDDTNGFDIEHLVKQLGQGKDEAQVRTEIVKCADKNPNKDNNCVWAWRGFNCLKQKNLPLIQTSVKKN